MPGSDWDVGVLARMHKPEEMPTVAPNLTGPSEIRAVAEAFVFVVEAATEMEEGEARALGMSINLEGVDVYFVLAYRQ